MSWGTRLFRVRKAGGELTIDYRRVCASMASDEWARLCRRYVPPRPRVRRWLGAVFATFPSGGWYVRLGRLYIRRDRIQWAGKTWSTQWPRGAAA